MTPAGGMLPPCAVIPRRFADMIRSPCAEAFSAPISACLFWCLVFDVRQNRFESREAASTAAQQLSGMLKYTTGLEFGEDAQSRIPAGFGRCARSATLDQMRILLAGAWQAAFYERSGRALPDPEVRPRRAAAAYGDFKPLSRLAGAPWFPCGR